MILLFSFSSRTGIALGFPGSVSDNQDPSTGHCREAPGGRAGDAALSVYTFACSPHECKIRPECLEFGVGRSNPSIQQELSRSIWTISGCATSRIGARHSTFGQPVRPEQNNKISDTTLCGLCRTSNGHRESNSHVEMAVVVVEAMMPICAG